MRYIQCRKLNRKKQIQIKQLEEQCFGTDRKPWTNGEKTANYINMYTTTDCYFLCFSADRLVGFISVYFPDEEAEMTAFVEPSYQRRGIFSKLLDMAVTELKKVKIKSIRCYPYNNTTIVEDAGKSQPALWKTKWTRESVELLMELSVSEQQKYKASKVISASDQELIIADSSKLKIVAEMEAELFGGGTAGAGAFLAAMEAGETKCYAFISKGKVSGACCISEGTQKDFLFGVVIEKTVRGTGLGSVMIDALIKQRKTCKHSICLQVTNHNKAATALYQKSGFSITQQQEVYIKSVCQE